MGINFKCHYSCCGSHFNCRMEFPAEVKFRIKRDFEQEHSNRAIDLREKSSKKSFNAWECCMAGWITERKRVRKQGANSSKIYHQRFESNRTKTYHQIVIL